MSTFNPVALAAACLALGAPAQAETPLGHTVESRIILGIAAEADAVAEKLPEGWTPVTLPRGPLTGVNVLVSLMDRSLIRDAEGAPTTPAADPAAAILAYARKDGVEGVRGFILAVFETPPVHNDYGNSVAADISRTLSVSVNGTERLHADSWSVMPETGGALTATVTYEPGAAGWSAGGESRPYSAVDPDFHRIYRYDQMAELVMNSALNREMTGEFTFTANLTGFEEVLGGDAEVVAILSIPVYVRAVSLP